MERVVWSATILPGRKTEYIRRHREVWPEMRELFDRAGMRNYSIWCAGDRLFGYYEAEFGLAHARQVQAAADVYHKWNESMRDLIAIDLDPATGKARIMEQVFLHEFKSQKEKKENPCI